MQLQLNQLTRAVEELKEVRMLQRQQQSSPK
jgi:hypothetical protein